MNDPQEWVGLICTILFTLHHMVSLTLCQLFYYVRPNCCTDNNHEIWYHPGDDDTFCARCQMRWDDGGVSRRSATFTVENGWQYDEIMPGGPKL